MTRKNKEMLCTIGMVVGIFLTLGGALLAAYGVNAFDSQKEVPDYLYNSASWGEFTCGAVVLLIGLAVMLGAALASPPKPNEAGDDTNEEGNWSWQDGNENVQIMDAPYPQKSDNSAKKDDSGEGKISIFDQSCES
ncbi:DUF3185 family protein [bacterium]|nr:DUF3185 family protein [bacterium]MBT7102415.1 DUF3185 family protein [archaeon]